MKHLSKNTSLGFKRLYLNVYYNLRRTSHSFKFIIQCLFPGEDVLNLSKLYCTSEPKYHNI